MAKCAFEYSDWREPAPCPHPAWQDSKEGLCIFHDKDPKKSESLFRKELKNLLEINCFDFCGFVFPKNCADFSEKTLAKADFRLAEFSGKADFNEAQFEGEANFSAPALLIAWRLLFPIG